MAAIDLDDGKTGGRGERAPGVRDLVDVFKFPEKKWTTIRLLPGLFSTAGYWVTTKKKDGGKGKFFVECPSYDQPSQERDSTKLDPWRDCAAQLSADLSEKERKDRDKQLLQFTQEWWMNAIIRSKQKQLPERMPKPTKAERASGFKDKDSDSLTAKAVIKLGRSLLGKIQELKGLNTVESKQTGAVKAFAVNDLKYGRDLRIYYDSSKAPADQYQVQLGDKRTPITEEEAEMLGWDLEKATEQAEVSEKDIMDNFEKWAAKMGIKSSKKSKKAVDEDEDFDDEDDEDDEPPAKKSKKSKKVVEEDDEDEPPAKKSKKSKKVVDEDDDFEDEDDEDDEPPAKKSKKSKPAKKSKKVVDEDEDEDDFDDEDEDDEPPAKKGKKSKKVVEEDEDDEDGDEDEPPAKKSKKSKKVVEEDDDFDDEDEDEDDEPPAKKGKAKPAKKSKKAVEEDDDFDDEDEDDEDDEPPAKKGKKSKPAKKDDEDEEEEDDDIPF